MDLGHIPPSMQRLWADEVLYLHSLWHQGPPQNPNPIPNPSLRPINSTPFKNSINNRKPKKKAANKNRNQPQPSDSPANGIEWPVNPSLDPAPEPSGWPEPLQNPRRPPPPPSAAEQARADALRLQQAAVQSCCEFFSKDKDDDDVEMSEDEEEQEEEESKAFEFFLGVFERDGELRGYYQKSHEKGEFLCLVCAGIGVKAWKTYGSWEGLVQHSTAIAKTKRRGAHRGFGRAMCRVLGWDFSRLPSIVLDRGEALAKSFINLAEAQDNLQEDDNIQDIIEIPNVNVEKDDSSRGLKDCDNAKDIEVSNKEGIDNREKLQTDFGKHVEGGVSDTLAVEIAWPHEPSLELKPDMAGREDLVQAPATAQLRQPPIAKKRWAIAPQAQQNGLKACRNFLAKSDDSSSDDDEEMRRESVAFKFFSMLFERDENLRNYYEKNCEKGEFCCLVCGGMGKKTWKRFVDCLGLVQHSRTMTDRKRRWAHRAFGKVVCKVLQWDFNGFPSICLATRTSQVQTLGEVAKTKGLLIGICA